MATVIQRRRLAAKVVHWVLLLAAMTYVLAPLVWMLLTSALPAKDLTRMPPRIDLSAVSFEKYRTLLADPNFYLPMFNSAVVAAATTVLCVVLGAPAAYAFARFRFRGQRVLLLSMLATQMIPAIVLAVPLFLILRAFGWLDTQQGLIVTYTAFILPIVVWMLVGFMQDIPPSLERAARIDGCNRLQTLMWIVLPLSVTGLAATAIFAFITAWSDFFLALVLTSDRAVTLTVRAAQFQGLFALDYKSAATAGVITTIPVLLLALVFQRWIVRGLTEGAVKG
jgi:ABC-type glycerol-3-phosphate transport system permease component